MVKTVLVYPSETKHTFPPLGIAYLAAVLRENNHEVRLIDQNELSDDKEFIQKLKQYNPDLIGFSVQTTSLNIAFRYAEMAKQELPNSFLIFGGPHASIMPEEVIKNRNVDACMIGEAEETIIQLVDALEKNRGLSNVNNLYYKEKGKVKQTERMPFIQDLDKIPFPARDLLPMHIYLKNIPPAPWLAPHTHLMVNRGCPFNCAFCQPTGKIMWGLNTRYRSPTNVINEMVMLKEKYKIKMLDVSADTLTVDKKWVYEFCSQIKERKVDLPWATNARVGTVDYNMLKAMKEAGLLTIHQGVESGSPYILNTILKKGINIQDIIKYFDWCKELGIITYANFLVGSPGETKETLNATIRLIRRIKPDYLVTYITTPIPGTDLYTYAKENNLLTFSDFDMLDYHHTNVMKLEHLTQEEIKQYRNKVYEEYAKIKLKNAIDPHKGYLRKAMLKRIISMARNVEFRTIKKSYNMLNTEEKNPIKRVKEMIIKGI